MLIVCSKCSALNEGDKLQCYKCGNLLLQDRPAAYGRTCVEPATKDLPEKPQTEPGIDASSEHICTETIQNTERSQKKYLYSGAFFSFALSTTFLPLLFGIADGSHMGDLFGICYLFGIDSNISQYVSITACGLFPAILVNFLYIVSVRNSSLRLFNLLLIPLNILVFLRVPLITSLRIEGNVFGFSLAFLLFPWFFLMVIASVTHVCCSSNPQRPSGVSQTGRMSYLKSLQPKAILIALACFAFFYFGWMFFEETL